MKTPDSKTPEGLYEAAVERIAESIAMRRAEPDYCAIADGRIYKYDLNTATETALPWPIAGRRCIGRAMTYSAARSSLLFAYSQNNLAGVAEYQNP